ncbi:MAG: hypothetical protein ISP49_08470 [Reyranella sp.]|nr:hypothetical protein [Reyranella sp.]
MSYRRLSLITLPLVLGAGLVTGACGVPVVAAGAGYAADGGVLAASDKTSADHLISMMSKQDCAMWRVIKSLPACKPRDGDKDPYKVDYDGPQRMVGEDGVSYAPPLHAAADAPAASWNAAAYKPPPVPSTPAQPVTAVADATPEPAPAAASDPPPAKPKKPKVHSVKKPSRNPVAPAS